MKKIKKEGFFKRLKNIEDKNEKKLKAIEDQGKEQLEKIKNINVGSKPLKTISFFSTISEEAKKLMDNIKVIGNWLETAQLTCTKTDGKTEYNFNKFKLPLKCASKIYRHDLTLQKAEDAQQKLKMLINKLNNDYNSRNETKIKEKDGTTNSAKKMFSIRENIIRAFKKDISSYIDGFQVEIEKDEETHEETDEETDKEIDEEMDFTIMPELESEESAEQRRNQPGKGLKILTPSQMLSRLLISLAQLEAGNISVTLKNEIRQLSYSFYHSKNMTKQVYNNLIKYI